MLSSKQRRYGVIYAVDLDSLAALPIADFDLLSRQITKMVLLPDVKERLATLGFGLLAGTSQELAAYIKAELAAYIKAESAEWRRVVREAKINVD